MYYSIQWQADNGILGVSVDNRLYPSCGSTFRHLDWVSIGIWQNRWDGMISLIVTKRSWIVHYSSTGLNMAWSQAQYQWIVQLAWWWLWTNRKCTRIWAAERGEGFITPRNVQLDVVESCDDGRLIICHPPYISDFLNLTSLEGNGNNRTKTPLKGRVLEECHEGLDIRSQKCENDHMPVDFHRSQKITEFICHI